MTEARTPVRGAIVFAAVTAVLAIAWTTLAAAPRLVRFFGRTGLNVMTRIMGLLVTVIAVQLIVDGARPLLVEVIRAANESAR